MEYLIPTLIFIVAVFFLVRHIRKSFKGEGACTGNCTGCQKHLQEFYLSTDKSASKKSSKVKLEEEHNV